jgi:hypothetical protein
MALALAAGALSPAASHAADPVYLGRWKMTGAVVAPWATPARKPDVKERARLIGKVIVFAAKAITGPDPFKCEGPHYALKDYPADFLFQGAFGEMHAKDKSVDPYKIAAGLGFKAASTRTLETGCEFDFHFIDAGTIAVGLNDHVYTLKKQ